MGLMWLRKIESKTIFNNCSGCRWFHFCTFGDNLNCPCGGCLVKALCSETCKERIEWAEEIISKDIEIIVYDPEIHWKRVK